MREMRIYVGPGLDGDLLRTLLGEHRGTRLKAVAHALLVDHRDDGAEILSVDVEKVVVDPDYPAQVEIEFETSWQIYKGCEDRNLSGIDAQAEIVTYTTDGHLIFSVPSPRRPANPC